MRGIAVLLTALALGAPSAGHADWLITRDGARVETDGPWEVKGRLVVFTRAGGGLASLRLADVDLDASTSATASARQATEAAAAAAASPAPAERRPPALVLTNADVAPAAEVDDESAVGAAEAKGFAVSQWDRLADEVTGEATVVGELRNVGREDRPVPTLVVSVFGADGTELASTDAEIEAETVPARESVRFRASFPGLASFSAAKFRIAAAPSGESATEESAEPAATPPDTPAPPSNPVP